VFLQHFHSYAFIKTVVIHRCTEKKRAMWTVGSISELAENGAKGCVRAKFDLGSSPSGPHLAALSFSCEGTTFSGVDLELIGSGYRASLVKKHIVTGEWGSVMAADCNRAEPVMFMCNVQTVSLCLSVC